MRKNVFFFFQKLRLSWSLHVFVGIPTLLLCIFALTSMRHVGWSAMLLLGIPTLIVAIGYTLFVCYINTAIQTLLDVTKQVSSGDLSMDELPVESKNEIGQFAHGVNSMVRNLRTMIQQVSDSALHVAVASEQMAELTERTRESSSQIASIIEEVARGAETQATGSMSTTYSMGEMSMGIQRIVYTSSLVSEASYETADRAEQGNEYIQNAINQMNSISVAADKSASKVSLLDKHSREIGQIIEVITEIASATQLLSLNASIEAARAGEHGRGFAVVANEVRKLATQSERSAQQIADLIHEIQSHTNQTAEAMDDVIREVQAGIIIVDDAGAAFQRILTSAQIVDDQIQEISAASAEMASGSSQVASAVAQMSDIAYQTSNHSQECADTFRVQVAAIQEMAASSEELSQLAHEMRQILQNFKI